MSKSPFQQQYELVDAIFRGDVHIEVHRHLSGGGSAVTVTLTHLASGASVSATDNGWAVGFSGSVVRARHQAFEDLKAALETHGECQETAGSEETA